ncbi:transcription factor grauzone [Musca vetustissima]|uniref:transcription factor grauzone n=1 Tax=Musca vetustissima TaxID=27455 RepID=UPI002AB7A85A|nr:transcription factor grauzone [Musca vetustissima]
MICRLCLNDIQNLINIFDSAEGYNIACVIGKYFWFEPRSDDPISTGICCQCYRKLGDFHDFFLMVEKAHRHMTERFVVKTENAKSKPRSMEDIFSFHSLPKPEPDEHEINCHVPLDILMENTTDLEKTFEEAAAIALGDRDDDRSSLRDEILDNADSQCESPNELSFDGEDFMKKILNNGSVDSKQGISKIPQIRRSTRHKYATANEKQTHNGVNTANNQRGRPKKVVDESNTNQQDNRMQSDEKTRQYKVKMKEIDAQIGQYMTLQCDACSTETENFASLRVHMRKHGIKRGYAKCCNKKFFKRALLLDHIRHHLDPEYFRCEDCDRAFVDRQSMRNHFLLKHQKEEDKIFECPQCSKKFAKKYLLEQHKMFTHRDRSTTCKNCNRRFETIEELVEHGKEHCHYGTMCDICAKVIRGPAAFKRHQMEHQGVTFPKVQCDMCGSWHKDKYALNKHKKRHLEAKQSHVCDICRKVSPSRTAMLSHKRYVHGSDKVYKCSICSKTFKKPLSLKEHMTVHTGEVLYRCPHCPKTFNSNANMHSHRKKIHPREFEETRKIRKQNAHLNQPPIPPISVLSNAKTDTQALLIIDTADTEETHNVLLTTSPAEEMYSTEEISDLSCKDKNPIIIYTLS